MFNSKLQFIHDMVEDTAFYHFSHFLTLQCISKWGNGDFLLGKYDLLTYLKCIARCESNMMERTGCMLVCYKGTIA